MTKRLRTIHEVDDDDDDDDDDDGDDRRMTIYDDEDGSHTRPIFIDETRTKATTVDEARRRGIRLNTNGQVIPSIGEFTGLVTAAAGKHGKTLAPRKPSRILGYLFR